jgi:hypothetical protein
MSISLLEHFTIQNSPDELMTTRSVSNGVSDLVTLCYSLITCRGERYRCRQHLSLYALKTGYALPCPLRRANVFRVLNFRFVCPLNTIIVCCQVSPLLSTLLYTLDSYAG